MLWHQAGHVVGGKETPALLPVSAASIRLLKATKICVTGKSNVQSYSCVRCNYTEAFQTQTRPSGGRVSAPGHLANRRRPAPSPGGGGDVLDTQRAWPLLACAPWASQCLWASVSASAK